MKLIAGDFQFDGSARELKALTRMLPLEDLIDAARERTLGPDLDSSHERSDQDNSVFDGEYRDIPAINGQFRIGFQKEEQ